MLFTGATISKLPSIVPGVKQLNYVFFIQSSVFEFSAKMFNKNSLLCKDDVWGKHVNKKMCIKPVLLSLHKTERNVLPFTIFSIQSYTSELTAVMLSNG